MTVGLVQHHRDHLLPLDSTFVEVILRGPNCVCPYNDGPSKTLSQISGCGVGNFVTEPNTLLFWDSIDRSCLRSITTINVP
jgi:hypothetical protein